MGKEKLEKIFEVVRIKQVTAETDAVREVIRSPENAAAVATKYIGDEDREVFLVLVLNTKNEVIAVHRCHIGSINASVVHPREVFKSAILNNGACIIGSLIGMKNKWRNYKTLYPRCYINFAVFLMAKVSLKVGWR